MGFFSGYQAAFSQLVFAGKKESDPCAGIGDPKIYLAKSLNQLSQAHPGKVWMIKKISRCAMCTV